MEKDKKAFRLVDPEGGLPEIYSNHVALGSTRDDIRIRFGQIIPLESRMVDAAFEWPEGNAKNIAGAVPGVVTERVAVTVSWQQAKRLSQLLADAVTENEGRKQPTTPHERQRSRATAEAPE
jgi:hypothetical protein